MAKSKTPKRYTAEFRRQMIELHRARRRITELAREFGPTSWTIVCQEKSSVCILQSERPIDTFSPDTHFDPSLAGTRRSFDRAVWSEPTES